MLALGLNEEGGGRQSWGRDGREGVKIDRLEGGQVGAGWEE